LNDETERGCLLTGENQLTPDDYKCAALMFMSVNQNPSNRITLGKQVSTNNPAIAPISCSM